MASDLGMLSAHCVKDGCSQRNTSLQALLGTKKLKGKQHPKDLWVKEAKRPLKYLRILALKPGLPDTMSNMFIISPAWE
ncbi:hypothetical protein J6590_083276 [Homalodisca vitripennis]|nr:hypothetical protein J6590_083276 [Homalodisca vitripennis]